MITFADSDLTIANVHLEPTRQGKSKRLAMLDALRQRCPTKELLVIGDTNTRVAEEAAIEQLGLLVPRPPRPTWDSKRNRFADPEELAAAMRAGFTAYYTRCFHTPGLIVDELEVLDQPTEIRDQAFYLSDHFALAGRVSINAS